MSAVAKVEVIESRYSVEVFPPDSDVRRIDVETPSQVSVLLANESSLYSQIAAALSTAIDALGYPAIPAGNGEFLRIVHTISGLTAADAYVVPAGKKLIVTGFYSRSYNGDFTQVWPGIRRGGTVYELSPNILPSSPTSSLITAAPLFILDPGDALTLRGDNAAGPRQIVVSGKLVPADVGVRSVISILGTSRTLIYTVPPGKTTLVFNDDPSLALRQGIMRVVNRSGASRTVTTWHALASESFETVVPVASSGSVGNNNALSVSVPGVLVAGESLAGQVNNATSYTAVLLNVLEI